jgi:hypothetical protein
MTRHAQPTRTAHSIARRLLPIPPLRVDGQGHQETTLHRASLLAHAPAESESVVGVAGEAAGDAGKTETEKEGGTERWID